MESNHSDIKSIGRTRPSGTAALFLALAIGCVMAGEAPAAKYFYGCVLSGGQEVPPNGSAALGGGQFLIDTDANTVSYRLTIVGLAGAETAAHIHGFAPPGVNAGVLTNLPVGNPKSGVWNYAEAQEVDILAGRTYANIHSGAFPGGEARGQIVPFNATLDGAQETPGTGSPGQGWAVFSIDTAANQLSYYIAFAGLAGAETAAHIHGMSLPGTAGGVLQALPLGSPKVGVWNYTDAQEIGILEGLTYVNIHTGVFPGGEIRGQINPIVIPIDGGQEVPPNASPGGGIALICYDTESDQIGYDVRFANLAAGETAAHIHGFAGPGAAAGVLQNLPLGARKLGVWAYGAANQGQVTGGLTYVNIHSAAFPAGEIRGQILGFPSPVPAAVADLGRVVPMELAQSAPNPFHDATRISFRLDHPTSVQLDLFDLQGRMIRTLTAGDYDAGVHSVSWDGRDESGRIVASGVYGYVLRTPEGDASKLLSFLR